MTARGQCKTKDNKVLGVRPTSLCYPWFCIVPELLFYNYLLGEARKSHIIMVY